MKKTHQISHSLIATILLLLFWPALSLTQDQSGSPSTNLRASLAPDPAPFGSLAVLTLDYDLPEQGRLLEGLEIDGLQGLTVVERQMEPGRITINLLVDQVGSLKTEPLALAYVDKDGNTQTLTSDLVSISVVSALGQRPEEAELRPIQGIIPTKAPWLRYAPWVAGLLFVLLAGAGILWWLKKGRFQTLSAEVMDPPHIRARKAIEELERQAIFEKGEIKGFYFRFSEILKRYLEGLRGYPAAEFTTEEIALRIDNEEDRRLLGLLRHADLVKFADTVPTPARKEEEVKAALSYIQETSMVLESDLSADSSTQKGGP
ncbi:MAG: hypothetical protein SWH78_09910 [Thermodesulfobacteriota bacterium]|nr:hypothetical protein [Thermodesulfobacteriota bacterium]